ncbi:helix-turn-helix domain-containing protein [Streptomyces luteogriseus]|uniref:helix-turn-helix domain-containing protein n=1 Tax=Streptomyces luteogriseus TaxID=68233 RepID=UPI0037ADA259
MTAPPDPAAARLLRPDGSVVIPPELAAEVLRTLVVGATQQARTDGGVIGPAARRLLHQLYEAAQHAHARDRADVGSHTADHPTVEITVAEAALLMGCRPRWIRTLLESGRLRGRRVNSRLWLVDRASLDHYRTTGGTACRTA